MLGKKLTLGAAGNNQQAGGGGSDADFANNVLLLQGDTANTSLSYNVFGDASGNSNDLTPVGDVYGTAFSPHNTSWSAEFGGSGDYLDITNSSDFNFGSGDFTIEGWAYLRSDPAGGYHSLFHTGISLQTYVNNNTVKMWASSDGSSYDMVNALSGPVSSVKIGQWFHFAAVRNGSTFTVYVDGVAGSTTQTSSSTIFNDGTPRIADYQPNPGTYGFNGYMSNFRIVKGTAIYTSNFTPSTTPLTAVSGTSLLTANSNRFVDGGGNNNTLTPSGAKAVNFSPFAETNTTDGSGFFDGTGDYLEGEADASLVFGTGDFTIECWCWLNPYLGGGSYWPQIVGVGVGNSDANTLGGTVAIWQGDGTGTSTIPGEITVILDGNAVRLHSGVSSYYQWTHVALTRQGTNLRLFQNGQLVDSTTDSTNLSATGFPKIGRSDGSDLYGFVSDVRIVKGTAVYTSAFTPPTAPLTAVSGTSLLTLQYRGSVRNTKAFNDSAAPSREITVNGNVSQGSFSPFSAEEGKWSNSFDGVDDRLVTQASSDFAMGTGDFTMECWVYAHTASPVDGYGGLISLYNSGNPSGFILEFVNGDWGFYNGSSHNTYTSVALNTWNHVALTRESGVAKLWVNGTLLGSVSSTINFSTNTSARVGSIDDDGSYKLTGYLSNVRIVKGTAVYTSAFTPPTEPLTAISGTVLLTCQSNRFVDNSSSAHALTVTGDTEVTPFSPFAPSAAYSPATNGGSAYVDDSGGDYLTLPSNTPLTLNSSSWTVDFWMYPTSYVNGQGIWGASNGGGAQPKIAYQINGSSISLYVQGSPTISATAPKLNEWTHVLISRHTNGNGYIYYNGQLQTSGSVGTSTVSNPFQWFTNGEGGTTGMRGYLSCGRVSSIARQTGSNFSIPTALPTLDSDTVLLCNFTDAGVFDGTKITTTETIGDSRIVNSVKKYGTGAIKFDGTTDRVIARGEDLKFGTGDFTIEMWIYFNNISDGNVYTILDGRTSSDTSNLMWAQEGSGSWTMFNGAGNGIQESWESNTFSTGTWYHIAQTRENGVSRFFVNGTKTSGDITDTSDYDSVEYSIGGRYSPSGKSLDGYIDDLRFTKGVARYTSSFTPPSAKLPNL